MKHFCLANNFGFMGRFKKLKQVLNGVDENLPVGKRGILHSLRSFRMTQTKFSLVSALVLPARLSFRPGTGQGDARDHTHDECQQDEDNNNGDEIKIGQHELVS